MPNLKPIWILFKAYMKVQKKSFSAFVFGILAAVMFSVVALIQIYIVYQINPDPFFGISYTDYLLAFFAIEVAFFLGTMNATKSFRGLSDSVKNSQLDIWMLRPVSFFQVKYFSGFKLGNVISFFIYLLLFMIGSVFILDDILIWTKLVAYILIAWLTFIAVPSFISGLVFYLRDYKSINRFYESVANGLFFNRPKEVFGAISTTSLVFLIPMFFTGTFAFEVIRGTDTFSMWLMGLCVLLFFLFLNWFVWKKGLKKYESMG
jgi:ABC-type uncharacterized transport system permease subunit